MSRTIPIDQASSQLRGLIQALAPGDEIVLTDNDKPVARIVPDGPTSSRQSGTCKGMIEILDDDDEVILEEFKDYMP
jgi:antitoxin (DNA-binding transcriptional repressor) of toxin-antitoxin stability system